MVESQTLAYPMAAWHPSRNTAIALLTELGMILAYALLGRYADDMLEVALIGLVVVPVFAVVIPVYWTVIVEHRDLAALGLTLRGAFPSLLLSLGLSLILLAPITYMRLPGVSAERWLPMAIAGAVSLFEPLFIFGWLQLRFEKDFGILPAILMAAGGFALYHVGYMPDAMSGEFYNAAVWAIAFRLTRNLLVTWPVLWATTSAYICYASNVCFFNWGMVTGSSMVFVLEIVLIGIIALVGRRAIRGGMSAHA
ncbi:MAG: type II CAAX prenyl endopeptidase Rce1 family protein [Rudaea sp.]